MVSAVSRIFSIFQWFIFCIRHRPRIKLGLVLIAIISSSLSRWNNRILSISWLKALKAFSRSVFFMAWSSNICGEKLGPASVLHSGAQKVELGDHSWNNICPSPVSRWPHLSPQTCIFTNIATIYLYTYTFPLKLTFKTLHFFIKNFLKKYEDAFSGLMGIIQTIMGLHLQDVHNS